MLGGWALLASALACAAAERTVFDKTEGGVRVHVVERRTPGPEPFLAYHELTVHSPSDELRVTRLTVHAHANVAPESAGPWLDGRPRFSDLPSGTARLFVVAADPAAPISWTLELGRRHPLRRNDVFDSYRFESSPPPPPPEYGQGRFTPTDLDRRLAALKERRLAEAADDDARTLPSRIERASRALADASDLRASLDEEEAEARAAQKEEMRARAQAREDRRRALVGGLVNTMQTVRRAAEKSSEDSQRSIRAMTQRSSAPPPRVPKTGSGPSSSRPGPAPAGDRPGAAPKADPPASVAVPPAPTCEPSLAGRYERPNKGGGRYGWYFVFGADCKGEFCAETLTDWDDGGSEYAYHCTRARELEKGVGLQKFDWTYDRESDSVILSGGKNETYKVHRADGKISIYTAEKVR